MKDEATLTTMGKLFKYDLSVRLQDTEAMLLRLKQRLYEEGFHIKGVKHKEAGEQVHVPLCVCLESFPPLCFFGNYNRLLSYF